MKALVIVSALVLGVSAFAAESAKTAPAKVEGTKMAAADKPNFKEECKAEGKTAKKDLKACIKEKKKAAKAAKEAPAAQ